MAKLRTATRQLRMPAHARWAGAVGAVAMVSGVAAGVTTGLTAGITAGSAVVSASVTFIGLWRAETSGRESKD